ncbi:MAG: PLP-dependent aspartate aminotransferase family protein [SAR324 cluster bacterium]|nr:PLP-dependent aspartate aminotransferase family protein [SAR324 cluster bacterium]
MVEKPLHPSTLAIHADHGAEDTPDIATPLHTTTTFSAGGAFIYARNDQPTRHRLEKVLGALEGGHAVTYSSGQAATYAAMRHVRPARVAVDRGYHGTHGVLARLAEEGVVLTGLDADFQKGDLIWLETPKNPTCEVEDIADFAKRAHAAGAVLAVDSTFATPLLQNPLALGADIVMHSSTKFISGHSDAMGGVLVVPESGQAEQLRNERTISGAIPGALETWLTLRSLRTLGVRVAQQSASAARLAQWLEGRVARVWHPSLSSHPAYELAQRQMRGPGGVLAIELDTPEAAQALPARLALFQDATSLGGVESLIEWRRKVDPQAPQALLRISVGLEAVEDLIADLQQGLDI